MVVQLKIGSLSLGPGYKWSKTGHSKSFNVDEADECITVEEAGKEEYTFRVYCKGNCDLGRSYELKERIDDALDAAIVARGRSVFLWQENGARLRRELLGGAAPEVLFELQRNPRQIVALDLTVSLKDSLILEPIGVGTISGLWADNDAEEYRAILVMEGSSVLTEPIPNFVADYAVLAEHNGSGYARALVKKRTISGTSYSSADISFPKLGVGTAKVAALMIIRVVSDDTDSEVTGVVPASLFGGPFDPTGHTVTFRVNLAGLFDTALPAYAP